MYQIIHRKNLLVVREQDEKDQGPKDQDQLLEENEGVDASTEAPIESELVEEGASTVEGQLAKLQKDHEELKDKYLRQAAEFENFKRRTVREKLDMISSAAQQTMRVLLPILDDFDRVKASSELPNSTEPFSEGVKMVYQKLFNTLATQGLLPLESNGESFDPDLHEAITEIPAPNEDLKGKVVDTVEKGYKLNDKLIRHAKVVVGK